VDGSGDHHVMRNKPDWERQICQYVESRHKREEWHEYKNGNCLGGTSGGEGERGQKERVVRVIMVKVLYIHI
jgi:hypothetical protein